MDSEELLCDSQGVITRFTFDYKQTAHDGPRWEPVATRYGAVFRIDFGTLTRNPHADPLNTR